MENEDIYAQQMKDMYKEAFAAAEKMLEAARSDRQLAADELEKARELRKQAEQEGERMALEYFAKRRQSLITQTREETLSAIVLYHLQQKEKEEEIMKWLQVESSFIARCKTIFNKLKSTDSQPHIAYTQEGRGGSITYISGNTQIHFDWEFGGGNAVAIIFIPEMKYWESQTSTPLSERNEILEFIAKQVVKDKAPSCTYAIGENSIEILN